MALSDNPERQGQPSGPVRAITKEGKWWSDSQKIEAVKTFLMTGNVAMTARILKIPEFTLRKWTKSVWWHEILDDLKQEEELVLSARLKKIVDKSFDVIEDRLENGDFVYDQKSGQMRRKQVAMRDAHKVAIDLVDKREKLLGKNGVKVSEEAVADKLLKLAEKFAELAGAKKLETNTIDTTVEEAVVKDQDEVVQNSRFPSEVCDDDFEGGTDEMEFEERYRPSQS